jgi:hypothetical protein
MWYLFFLLQSADLRLSHPVFREAIEPMILAETLGAEQITHSMRLFAAEVMPHFK